MNTGGQTCLNCLEEQHVFLQYLDTIHVQLENHKSGRSTQKHVFPLGNIYWNVRASPTDYPYLTPKIYSLHYQ
jgi:hypothetical protein